MGGAPVGIKIKIPLEHEEENNKSECSHIQINLLQTNYGLTLIIDGHIQFAEKDEYIYREALVHPAMALAGNPETVLIIGEETD
jgi:spermidine synthase